MGYNMESKSLSDTFFEYLSQLLFGSAIFFLTFSDVMAYCEYRFGTPKTIGMVHFSINNNLVIPRNASIGTVLHTSQAVMANNSPSYRCTDDSVGIMPALISSPTDRSNIFPVGNNGLGMRFKRTAGNGILTPYGQLKLNDFLWRGFPNNDIFSIEIIKIGDIQPGAEIQSGYLGSYLAGTEEVARFFFTQRITITPQTCMTPNVTVSMGTPKTSDFTVLNKRITPVPFDIKLNSCPNNMNSIKYRIDPTTSIINSSESVVSLSSESTAKGVGVQILDASNNPLPLGSNNTFSSYVTSGGNFSIPLKAAYYKQENVISGGIANTSLTFTMTYQ